jgi:hypothetical protein
MTTSNKAARNSRFQKGSGMYACRCCERNTRSTGNGDNEFVRLCTDCYDLAGEDNHYADRGTFYSSAAEVLALIASVAEHGGNASCWDELKAKAEALANPAPAAAEPVEVAEVAEPAEPVAVVEVLHPEYAAALAIAHEEIARARAKDDRQALVERFGDLSAELHELQARVAALSAERDGIVAKLLQSR